MSEKQDQRMLVVLHWSDGTRNTFFTNKDEDLESFIIWKSKHRPCGGCELTSKEKISVEDYKQKYQPK